MGCNTAAYLTGCLMRVMKDVLVAEVLLLSRQGILTMTAQKQDEALCHVPEGDIN